MFFIFGWGHQKTKDYGATLPAKCPNCNNETFLNLVCSKVYFSLFFIPLIPYETKYYLLCNICSQGIELNGSEVDDAKKLNDATLSFMNGRITEGRYNEIIRQYGRCVPGFVAPPILSTPPVKERIVNRTAEIDIRPNITTCTTNITCPVDGTVIHRGEQAFKCRTCGAFYHPSCARQHLRTSNNCLICKKPLT